MARFFEAIDDVSGDYARIFNKSSIEVINFTSLSDLVGVGYNEAFNIPLDRLEVGGVELPILELVNNPSAADLSSYKALYKDYPLSIRGAHVENFNKGTGEPVAVTPITFVTDYQHIVTGEKKKCVTKTYYFLERTKSGKTYYWQIVRLTICAILENEELYSVAYNGAGVFEYGTDRMWLRYGNVVYDDVVQKALAGYNPAQNGGGNLDPSYHDSVLGDPYGTRSNLSANTALEYLLMINEGKHINAQPLVYEINAQRNGLKGDRQNYIGNPCLHMIGTNWTIYKQEESRMGIPVKKIFRSGVDYLHNIDVYDETNRASKNMMLENYVGTTNYELVNFSSPNGIIRVKNLKNFTHFVGAGFGNNNTPRVYRVTSYKTVGSGIIEYSFTIDYLKDYFQHYDIDEGNDLRVHAGDANWYMPEKTLGNEPVRGLEIQKKVITENIDSAAAPWLVSGSFAGSAAAAFLLSDEQLLAFYNYFITSETSDKDAGAIFRIERIDYESIASNTEVANLDIWGNTVIENAKRVLPSTEHVNEYKIDFILFDGLTSILYENGVEYDAKTALYVEYYGAIDCNSALKRYLQEKGKAATRTIFKLTVDIISGQTSLSIDDITDFPVGSLPQMPVITNSAPQQFRQWGMNTLTSIGGGFLGGAIGGIKTGNAAAVAGLAVAGAIAGAAKSVYDYQTILQTAGPQISGGAGGTAYNGIFFIIYKVDEAFPSETLYERVGYPTDTLATVMEEWRDKQRYTVELIDPYIGTEEYGRNAKAAIEEDYIIYNYSTAAGV